MNHSIDTLLQFLHWAGKSTSHNLEFVSDDRLTWKPAPTALSAVEIIHHVSGSLQAIQRLLDGAEWQLPDLPVPQTRSEAQALLDQSVAAYAAALERSRDHDFTRIVKAGRRGIQVPLGRAAGMPVADLIHHHGQIAYLQTLWGDTDTHAV